MNLPKALKMPLLSDYKYDSKKYFLKSKEHFLVISVVSKTGFGIFLAQMVCLKSEK
jgi:hypothetical protein